MIASGFVDIYLFKDIPSYFDRRIFFYNSLSDYLSFETAKKISDINFNPADGVRTSLDVLIDDDEYTYLLVVNPTTSDIISRWFIVEADRNMEGQYHIQLKRDTIADNFNDVITAPVFVEKANLRDSGNPLLFNKEGMTYNQIKKEEIQLKDKTGVAWLVGYILQDTNRYPTTGFITAETTINTPTAISFGDIPFADCISFEDGSTIPTRKMLAYSSDQLNNKLKLIYGFRQFNDAQNLAAPTFWLPLDLSSHAVSTRAFNNLRPLGYIGQQWNEDAIGAAFHINIERAKNNYIADYSTFLSYFKSYFLEKTGTVDAPAGIWDYNGKIIVKDGKYYKLSLSIGSSEDLNLGLVGNESDYRVQGVITFLKKGVDINTTVSFNRERMGLMNFYSNSNLKLAFGSEALSQISIVATQIQAGTIKTKISGSRNHVEDDCFDMFAIPYYPYSDKDIYFKEGGTTYKLRSIESLSMARALLTAGGAGTGWAKDLQLLPYCPFDEEEIMKNGRLDLSNLTENYDYETIMTGDESLVVSFMLLCKRANFTKNIELQKEIERPREITFTTYSDSYFEEDMTLVTPALPDLPYYYFEASLSPSGIAADYIDTWTIYEVSIERYDLGEGEWVEVSTSPTFFSLDKTNNKIICKYPQNVAGLHRVSFSLSIVYKQLGAYYNPLYLDMKISNECDLYRLVSPNYNGLFEFSLAKFIDGKMNYINVDCSYKPFIPYIHLNPDFSNLYGQDWNDSRGLICAGDFSLSLVSDPWTNYVLNNKNYQAIFDRQIKSLDINNAINMEKTTFASTVGVFTGGAGGAAGGAMAGFKSTGSPYGAVAGAAAGASAGFIGGVAGAYKDIDWLNRQQREQRLYAVDLYNYTLGNVQALPQSLSKSSPFTYNNKIFPILEHFSSTDKEKEILKEKIKYEGMTIMSISQIVEYLTPEEETYIKGRLIRSGSIKADSHVLEDIYSELAKGAFLKL